MGAGEVVHQNRPRKRGRVQILRVHVKKVKLDPDADLEKVAELPPGFTSADLANMVNEAALAATRRDANSVGFLGFNAGFERIIAGMERKNRLLNPREREIVAFHEMGHAIVALGYTIQRPTEDRYLMICRELENRMAVLRGRAAMTAPRNMSTIST